MSEENVSNELRDHLAKLIDENEIILFMKGTPEGPACGFSARSVGVLNSLGKRYAAVDILPDPRIREELTAISDWPTIPQLFVGGELIGGSDIMMEMYESGELAEALGVEQPEDDTPQEVAPAPQPQGLQLENNLE
jgi:monothiol glutaredoxin